MAEVSKGQLPHPRRAHKVELDLQHPARLRRDTGQLSGAATPLGALVAMTLWATAAICTGLTAIGNRDA
ncbi:hypothetical protein NQK81_43405 [Amycolatopsis roodepoortensis]|uniref:hypothetical protein n=1 Tax=Amycolatopsis roodepoortensis TaxID=700274 RepID=UPI00214C5304|nr:hypothetical protein [Amycolatopsis roodepoortensis]UUV31517.1 hypothetical protein NQK81_43405 [Amycolatopsis roodepoortensis]